MAISAEQLGRELRAFDGRRKLVQAMRRGMTTAAKPLVKNIRAHARATLPQRGGLAGWVASARIGVRISYAARSAGIKMSGGRKSIKDRSDLKRIDDGQVRAPSWGRRGRGSWHVQSVTPGWWSTPLEDDEQFVSAVEAEVDRALDELRG